MIEIFVLIILGKKVAKMCRNRGRSAWPWVILLILSWYGGALAGLIVAGVAANVADPNAVDPPLVLLFVAAIGGAVCGVLFTLGVVSLLPDARDYGDDEDDYDDRPRRRRRYEDDRQSDDYGGEQGRRYNDDDYEDRRARR